MARIIPAPRSRQKTCDCLKRKSLGGEVGLQGLHLELTILGSTQIDTLPPRDHRGRHAIAQHIHRGLSHVQQPIRPHQNRDADGRPNIEIVPASTTIDEPVTPAAPLLVSISVNIRRSCVPNDRCIPAACATKMAASDWYSVLPVRLRL